MKIIFSSYDDLKNPYYAGGGARAVHEVAKRLAQRHEVTVITGKYPGSADESVENVHYSRIGGAQLGPKTGQLYFQSLLPLEVRRRNFDVWIESLTPPFSTACLQLFSGKPVVALTQILSGRAMRRKYGLPFDLFERTGLKTYRYAIALSEYLKKEIQRANPSLRIAVIPNGADDELIHKEFHKTEEHILFLGRIDIEQKGIDLLLNAYKSVADSIPFPLVIAGSGALKDEAFLKQRIVELNLQGRVRAVGRLTGTEKEDALRKAAFFMMPSRFEAFPLALLEAFCYRLPVILFRIPELAELPDACCLKIEPFDARQFAQAALTLANDKSLRESMGTEAKQFARGFGWESLAQQYEQFVTAILQHHK